MPTSLLVLFSLCAVSAQCVTISLRVSIVSKENLVLGYFNVL